MVVQAISGLAFAGPMLLHRKVTKVLAQPSGRNFYKDKRHGNLHSFAMDVDPVGLAP
jgi:hypothetical protein